jgi:subtilisin family serine protease
VEAEPCSVSGSPAVRPHLALTALLVLASALLAAWAPAAARADETKPYIVVFEPSSAAGARAATTDLATDERFSTTQRYDDAVHGFAAKLDAHDLDAVRDDPRVAAVVPDKPVKATALVPLAAGDNIPTGVRRVGAAVGTTVREASTANVAVIDTGVDLSHPDLNAVAGANCNGTGPPTDWFGHGTHVAGIIAAKNNGGGAVGVAPGTKIWAVRVLGSNGSGYTSQIICGIDWVTSTRTDNDPNNDIAVANMSLGGGSAPNDNCGRTVNDPEHIAICNSIAAGVTYVVAAGNSNADEQTFAPANYPEVLTVTAESDSDGLPGGIGGTVGCVGNADDSPASYSNFATRAADVAHTIAAPGSCIRSTYPGGQYATMSGTSMASPAVAGLVALCEGENGAHGPCWGQSPAVVKSIMLAAAATAAGEAPDSSFTGSPARSVSGRYYGYLASTRFPSTAGVTPVAATAPVITGTAAPGATLSASTGTFSGSGVTTTRQWLRCTSTTGLSPCSAIAGATGATYQPVLADTAKYLRVRAVGRNGEGAAIVVSNPTAAVATPVAPSPTVAASIVGIAALTHTLTGKTGTWSGTAPITYTQQWQRCTNATSVATCANIAGATALTYAPVSADVGKYLRIAVSATNARSTVLARSAATAAVTDPSAPAPIANLTLPGMLGVGIVTHTLSGVAGTWKGSSPSSAYAWQRCTTTTVATCVNIAGATGMTYLLTAADRGKYVRFAVTVTNTLGSALARSGPLGPIK